MTAEIKDIPLVSDNDSMKQSLVEIASGLNQDISIRAKSGLEKDSKLSKMQVVPERASPTDNNFITLADKLTKFDGQLNVQEVA